MTVSLSPILNGYQSFLANGLPNNGGFIHTYLAGSSTPAVTYTTNSGAVANQNPIPLSASGTLLPGQLWITDGIAYKFVVTDAHGVPIPGGTNDNISSINSVTSLYAGSSGSALIGFLQSGAGAIARTSQSKMRDIVSILDFGADPTGIADSLAAFNAALATHTTVYVPTGSYSISGTITMGLQGQRLIGDGKYATVLTATSANLPLIQITADINGINVIGMQLNRTLTPTPGGHGINYLVLGNFTVFRDLVVYNQYVGLNLGSTGFSFIEDVIVSGCMSDGFAFVTSNVVGGGQLQWNLTNTLSQLNAGRGYAILGNNAPTAIATSLGTWINCNTFANTGGGILVQGSTGSGVYGFRLRDSFIGGDSVYGLNIDSYGALHNITGSYFQVFGLQKTGPGAATPVSNVGVGVIVSVNNDDFLMDGCYVSSCANQGMLISSTLCQIVGTKVENNGQSGVNTVGISLASRGGGIITGCSSIGATQTYGIYFTADIPVAITGCDLRFNTTAAIGSSVTLTQLTQVNNLPSFEAWGYVNGTTGALIASSNILEVIHATGGGYVIYFKIPVPTANYLITTGVQSNNDANSWTIYEPAASAHDVNSFVLETTSNNVLADCKSFSFVVRGY